MDHLEIEFKILINQETYEKIIADYQSKQIDEYSQTNYYLFHDELDKRRYSLRIRYKKGKYELTLKTPHDKGLNEYNLDIDEKIKEQIFHHQKISNKIFDFLEKENIHCEDLICGSYLTTYRHDIPLENGLLSIDRNEYNHHVDYEIEFEVNDYEKGLKQFQQIIEPYGLIYKENCLSKIRRMKQTL